MRKHIAPLVQIQRGPYLVLDVLVAELSLQVAFLALDDAAPHQAQNYGEQQDGQERVGEGRDAAVDQGHAQVEGLRVNRKGPR